MHGVHIEIHTFSAVWSDFAISSPHISHFKHRLSRKKITSTYFQKAVIDCDHTCTRRSPGERASRVCSRSRSWARDLYDWLHKNRFFVHATGCILIKLCLSVTFPFLCPFRFLPLPNPQMAVSVQSVSSAIADNSHTGSETVYEALLRPTLSLQTKYQAAFDWLSRV